MLFHYQRTEIDYAEFAKQNNILNNQSVCVGVHPNFDLTSNHLQHFDTYFVSKHQTLFFESNDLFTSIKYLIENFEQGFVFLLSTNLSFTEELWDELFFGVKKKIFTVPYRNFGIFLTLNKFKLNDDKTIELPSFYQNFQTIYMTLENETSIAEISLTK